MSTPASGLTSRRPDTNLPGTVHLGELSEVVHGSQFPTTVCELYLSALKAIIVEHVGVRESSACLAMLTIVAIENEMAKRSEFTSTDLAAALDGHEREAALWMRLTAAARSRVRRAAHAVTRRACAAPRAAKRIGTSKLKSEMSLLG